jgi:tetratricopeptide (TPR) repeat protein
VTARIAPIALLVALALPASAVAARRPPKPAPKPAPAAASAPAAAAAAAELGPKEDSGGPSRELAGDVARERPGAKKAESRPTLEYDKFRFTVELQLKEKRRELMATLEQMVALTQDPNQKPDLLFRLGELDWEESKYWFFEANRQDGKAIDCRAKKDAACAKQALAEKKEFAGKSAEFQDRAIDRYKTIIKAYPKYGRMDEVLFFLGQNLWEKGKPDDALKAYGVLVQRYPKSRFVPDAYLAFGEFYFNTSQGKRDLLQKALEAYTKAASYTDSKVYGFAIYKQGWCQYNLGDYEAAADKFKAVVYYGELATNVGSDNKNALVREARKDFVLAYSRYGDPTGAREEFKRVGGDENWWSMLKGLAGLYYDDGKDKEAVLVYRSLIKERPLSPEAPLFQGRIVAAVMRVGNKRITVEQARLLVKTFQDVEKSGAVRTDEDRKLIDDARDLSERTLSNLAVVWHNEGKKTRDDETFTYANAAYGDYLSIFPDSKKAYDLRFFHAELLYENLQKYEEAAEEYHRVVAMDAARLEKKEKPGKWMQKAAEGAIYSYDEVVKRFETKEPKPAAKGKEPLTIPAPKAALLAACENYLKLVPNGEKRVEVYYKAAQIYYRYNHLDEAVKRFSAIALEHPEDELAVYSANLVLDAYNLLEDYPKIDEWARRFRAEPKLAKGEFRAELDRILERNSFKLAEAQEKAGRFAPAAERYVTFVAEWPKSELADEALFNASVDYARAGQIEKAIELRGRIGKEYPGSNLAPQALFLNASQYEEIGEFGQAAGLYETYAARWEAAHAKAPKAARGRGKGAAKETRAATAADRGSGEYEEGKAKAALYNAGVFREALGDGRRALKNREKYLELWPDDVDAEAVSLSIAELHEKSRAYGAALRKLEEYESRYGREPDRKIVARYRAVRIYERQGNRGAAKRGWETIWDEYRKLGPKGRAKLSAGPGGALEAVAWAHYQLSAETFAEFDGIKLRLPEAMMAERLKEKGRALLGVQRRYTETVAFKVPGPAVCALDRIGLAYRRFAQSLYDAPVPPGLRGELVDAYKQALAEQATPVEAKAIEAFSNAVAKAREFSVDDACAKEALSILEEVAGDRYPKVVETPMTPRPVRATKEGRGLVSTIQPVPKPVAAADVPAVVNEKAPTRASPPPPAGKDAAPGKSADRELERSSTAPVAEPPLPAKKSDEPEDEDLL